MSNRLDKQREETKTPQRVQYAIDLISKAGYSPKMLGDKTIIFNHNGNIVTVYPYSGWFTGRGIQDGRGIANLIKQVTYHKTQV